jgi:hypothetical protein
MPQFLKGELGQPIELNSENASITFEQKEKSVRVMIEFDFEPNGVDCLMEESKEGTVTTNAGKELGFWIKNFQTALHTGSSSSITFTEDHNNMIKINIGITGAEGKTKNAI